MHSLLLIYEMILLKNPKEQFMLIKLLIFLELLITK